jgi:hypothetical protein
MTKIVQIHATIHQIWTQILCTVLVHDKDNANSCNNCFFRALKNKNKHQDSITCVVIDNSRAKEVEQIKGVVPHLVDGGLSVL